VPKPRGVGIGPPSTHGVIAVVSEHTAKEALADCVFYYGVVALRTKAPPSTPVIFATYHRWSDRSAAPS
jgi:hypothetical protein